MSNIVVSRITSVLLIALVVRLTSLDQSFWLDETTTATVARDMPLSEFFSSFLPGDFHPPLHYLTVKAWGGVFGFSEMALRFTSVLFGLATVYLTYRIGKLLNSGRVGLMAAALLAVAPLHIYYSQELRMYAMTAFLATVSFYHFLRLLDKPQKSDWILWSTSIALLLLTDYLPMFILPVFWAYARRAKLSQAWWKQFLLGHITLAVAALLIFPIFLRQASGALSVQSSGSLWWRALGSTTLKNTLLIFIKFITGRVPFDGMVIALTGTAGLLIGISLLKTKVGIKKLEPIWYWLVVPIVIGLVIGFFVPVVQFFRFLFVLPALYLLIAFGTEKLGKLKTPVLASLLTLSAIFSGMYLLDQGNHRENWKGLAEYVGSSAVLFVADSQMEAFRYYSNVEPAFGPSGINKAAKEIYLTRYVQDIFDPEDKTREALEAAGFEKSGERNFNGIEVWKYEKII